MSDEPCMVCGDPAPLDAKGRQRLTCTKPECRSELQRALVMRSSHAVRKRREEMAGERPCRLCGVVFPLDAKHFPLIQDGRLRRECITCSRREDNKRKKARYAKIKAEEPERYAEMRANARIYDRGRLLEAGKERLGSDRDAPDAYRRDVGNAASRLPVEPVAAWLDEVLRHEMPDLSGEGESRGRTAEDLAAELGTSSRRLWSLRHRAQTFVALSTADTMLTRYGRPVVLDGERMRASLEARCRAMPGNGERLLRYLDLAETVAHLDGVTVVERIDDLWPELA